MDSIQLKEYLDQKVAYYNQQTFIEKDPISVPHRFTNLQDIEISGFFAAMFAWGQRKTIINKANDLMDRMDNAPFDFVMNHTDKDLKRIKGFVHRTFNDDDALYFIEFFKQHYSRNESFETAFSQFLTKEDETIEPALRGFKDYFFSWQHFRRTEKHIASPKSGSACKRICMYLRWLCRDDQQGVDFGLWKNIKPSQLMVPLDVHVLRVAQRLGMIDKEKSDFKTLKELNKQLKQFDPNDPVKYDYALFGVGVEEKF